MNFRNHSNTELISVLTNEPRPNRFIEAAKEFISRHADNIFDQEEMDDATEKARLEGFDDGIDSARKDCRNEAHQILENSIFNADEEGNSDWVNLLSDMKYIG